MFDHLSDQPSLSARSVAVAGHTGDEATVLAALNSPEADVRIAAVSALVRLGSATKSQMQLLMRDADVRVRRASTNAVPRTKLGAELVPDLLRGLDDEMTVVEVSAFALGEIGDISPSVIEKLTLVALDHEDALCREAAVAALGSLGEGKETILAKLDDVATVRRRAVIALAPFDGPDVEAALQNAMTDRDWQVRQAAEDLVAEPELPEET